MNKKRLFSITNNLLSNTFLGNIKTKKSIGKGQFVNLRVFGQDKAIKRQIYNSGFYKPVTDDLKQDSVILDIGAHIGLLSLLFSRKLNNGKIISLEPDKDNYYILRQNIAMNKIKNIIPIKKACSDKNEKIRLSKNKYDSGAHSIMPFVRQRYKQGDNFELVDCITIDSLIKSLNISKVDLIKLDVEGASLLCLKGALNTIKKFKPNLLISTYHYPDELKDNLDFIKPLDYHFKIIYNEEGSHVYAKCKNTSK